MHFLLDIGGTKTRIASSLDLEELQNLTILPTSKDYHEELILLKEHIANIKDKNQITSAVIGIAGIYNDESGILENAPNLKDWIGENFLEDLREVFKTNNITIKNDAALAALAEATSLKINMGAEEIVAYITIGTGVGGARVVNKVLDPSTFGFEPGHQIINFDNEIQESLEDYISGSGIKRKFGIDLSDKTLQLSSQFKNDLARYVAIGLNNISLMWSPDVLIIGGGLGISEVIDLNFVQTHFDTIFRISKRKPLIQKATLGDLSGLHGARILAKEPFTNFKL